MADSHGSRHGTSYEYHDHCCESCEESAGAVGTTKQQGRPVPVAQQASLGQMKATSIGSFNVRTKDDEKDCCISGIAITPSGQRLLVDSHNQKVKLFSKDMRFLTSVSFLGWPVDITVLNGREAVVTVVDTLTFLEVTDGKKLEIKHKIRLSFNALGVTYNKDKFIVTDFTTIHALDIQGTELWSVGQPLFNQAWDACINSDGRWVAVTDCGKNTIAVLDTNNGAVITSRQLEMKLKGVSVDTSDNIFVCATPNIVVLSGDLNNEHMLFDMGDKRLHAIAYDNKQHQLTVIHGLNDSVSCLQLS